MRYISNEIKRNLRLKIFITIIFLPGVVSYIMYFYDGGSFAEYYTALLSNMSLMYLIALCSAISTDDFEYGTFKTVYTGKYSFKQVLSLKILICIIIGAIMSFSVFFVPVISSMFIEKSTVFQVSFRKLLLILAGYSAASFSLGTFGIMMGMLTKRFSSNFIITLLLFFGLFAQLIETASMYLTSWVKTGLSLLPFTVVPKVITSGSVDLFQAAILMCSGLAFITVTLLYRKVWRR